MHSIQKLASFQGVNMMNNSRKITKKSIKFHKMAFACGIIGVVVLNIAAWLCVDFCDWYVKYIFPLWLNTYARLTSIVPVSVGEIMLVLAVVITVFGIGFFIWNMIQKNRYRTVLRYFGTVYAWIVLIVCYIMTLNCFILYHTTDFAEKYLVKREEESMVVDLSENAVMQVPNEQQCYTRQNLAVLRNFIVERCNTLALEIARDDNGDAVYNGDLIAVAKQAMIKLGEEYDLLSGFYVTPKYLTCSEFFSQQYIMGYYFPFSLEANINSVMYITNVAPTVCHELAHTKGFIYEDDANMIGFLACIRSDDPFLQYCGYLSVLNYVNNDFYDSINRDKNLYTEHIRISDLVADDNIFLTREDWQTVEKRAVIKTATVKKVSNALMETTLKLNGVEEGMQQYGEVVTQLLQYYDGELF